ncbi:MAG: hypothetical protein KDA96_19465, partial [Planctomycetaceae bacterium]|nr:hypothetical protein [Planctomycetaceae bacterium]
MTELRIRTRDPIVARDGRPFGSEAGNRMRCMNWLSPSVTTGAIRTLLGRLNGGDFQNVELLSELKQTVCRGPLLVVNDRLFLPAPADALCTSSGESQMLRPDSNAGSCDLPKGLIPVTLDPQTPVEKFSCPPPAWWAVEKFAEWHTLTQDPVHGFYDSPGDFLRSPVVDERTHVAIDPGNLAAKKGMLFSTAGLVLDRCLPTHGSDKSVATELVVGIAGPPSANHIMRFPGGNGHQQPVGGERRLTTVHMSSSAVLHCPDDVAEVISTCQRNSGLRMTLVTPAIFSGGWLPGWLDRESRSGTPPALAGTGFRLQLEAVCNARWEAVSGWSYESRGPKAVRRIVPAGSTYYFKVLSTDGAD